MSKKTQRKTLKSIRNILDRGLSAPDLTERQSEVVSFILREWSLGWMPTIRDIGEEFGIRSPNGVMCHLTALRKKGYVTTANGRGLGLTDKSLSMVIAP